MYVSLAPCHISNPVDGIKIQHLDSLVMRYFSKARGVVLGYSNIVLNSEAADNNQELVATVSDLSPFMFMWITVDLLLWAPRIGDVLMGYIYMLTATHLGLLVHDTFNAHIQLRFMPESWLFIPNQADELADAVSSNEGKRRSNFRSYGYWVDQDGLKVEGKLAFTVREIHTAGKMISLAGTLVLPESELDARPVCQNNDRGGNVGAYATAHEIVPEIPGISQVPDNVTDAVSINKHVKFDSDLRLLVPEDKYPEDGGPGYENDSDSDSSDSD